jgi:SAM-dependent methyltransferase
MRRQDASMLALGSNLAWCAAVGPNSPIKTEPAPLRWKVDEYSSYFDRMRLRGWCFVPGSTVAKVEVLFPSNSNPSVLASFGLASPDVASMVDPGAHHVRFDEWVALPETQRGRDFILRIHLTSGEVLETTSVAECARIGDPAHNCWYHFLDRLGTIGSGEILEIGSRARSAITVRQLIPQGLQYVGLDILDGPNVDLVGDAHGLAAIFATRRFAAAFARSVFEHLAMPWKVVIELNRVLKPGGLVFVSTHQTWVLHEEPWDFWRFSTYSWPCLFNEATGFEILEVAHGEPARVHPMWDSPIVRDMPNHPAFLSSAVIAKKIGETSLSWPAPSATAIHGSYPPGDLSQPPHSF